MKVSASVFSSPFQRDDTGLLHKARSTANGPPCLFISPSLGFAEGIAAHQRTALIKRNERN